LCGIEIAAGLALLLGGGEALVRGSVGVAFRLGVSPLLIGLTLVGFGTSTPELVASLHAAHIGATGIAVGNVVGSNIANILLILGVSAIVLPVAISKDAFRRDGTVLILASLLMLAVVLSGALTRLSGLAFLSLLVGYAVYCFLTDRRSEGTTAAMHAAEVAHVAPRRMSLRVGLLIALGGIAGVIVGAGLLVDAAVAIASAAGIPQTVIGLTLVAVGTSLPELAASLTAAVRRQGDLAFGNIVGSNIFNILGIAGATALFAPLSVPAEIIHLDIWVMIGSAIILVVFAMTGWRIGRREGALFLSAYAAYLLVLF
jgi:cation:H+ antiporter